mmetsp:Transcript_24673/g.41380  ORF Transcript_24673/g.41380 Transcript_24673/m.41380 type:complete len:404 (-) Transcript_24673:364-1575(-)
MRGVSSRSPRACIGLSALLICVLLFAREVSHSSSPSKPTPSQETRNSQLRPELDPSFTHDSETPEVDSEHENHEHESTEDHAPDSHEDEGHASHETEDEDHAPAEHEEDHTPRGEQVEEETVAEDEHPVAVEEPATVEEPVEPPKAPTSRKKKVKKTVSDTKRWWFTESFKDKWIKRSRGAVGFVKQFFYGEPSRREIWDNSLKVLDIGCGPFFFVSKFLPETVAYTPCDIVKRDERTYVIDLNLKDDEVGVPNPDGDVPDSLDTIRRKVGSEVNLITMLGVAEYVADVPRLFQVLKRFACPIMITYSTLEMVPDRSYRKRINGWISHYSSTDLMQLIRKSNFNCFKKRGSTLFYLLLPTDGNTPAEPCVDVVLKKEMLGEIRKDDEPPSSGEVPHRFRYLFL